MSTDYLLHPAPVRPLARTIDGFYPSTVLPSDDCCGPQLCDQSCDMVCSFINLLPTGPLWDRAKEQGVRAFTSGGDYDPCNPPCYADDNCVTLVNYAVFAASALREMLGNILWPSLRESQGHTAVKNLDDWLDRLGWQDCFRSNCRTVYMSELSPYEIKDELCGTTEYCPTAYPDDFECALKHATVLSLLRAQRGIIRNLDGINFVLEPLGVAARPRQPYPVAVQEQLDGDECSDALACFCDVVELELFSTTDTLAACPSLEVPCGDNTQTVSALQTYQCQTNGPLEIYPAVITALCIANSLMTKQCPTYFTISNFSR